MAKALTAASIARFEPGDTRREIHDGLQPGLYLIVQPTGVRSWAVRYRFRGKPTKYTIGAYPAFDLASARREARDVLQMVARGTDPARVRDERRRAESTDDTFEVVAGLWIEKAQRPHNRSWKEPARLIGLRPDPEDAARLVTIKDSLADKWGDRKLGDIRRRDLIPVLDTIVESGAPIAANRTQAALHALFAWAISRDLIEVNPVSGIERQKETSRDRFLADDEVRRVWQAAGEIGWPFGPIARLLILTGARREEIGGLRWQEIHDDRIELTGDRTKNGEPHMIPLSPPAVEILRGLHKVHGSAFVFTSTGTTPVSGFAKAKAKIDQLSGVTDWRLHDLRRTVATGLQRLGVRLEVTEAVLGHTSGSRSGIVGVYQRYEYSDEKRAALDRWSRHVIELVDGKPTAQVVPLHGTR